MILYIAVPYDHLYCTTILRYAGVLDFVIRAFLETPLKMVDEGQQESELRTRKKGGPYNAYHKQFLGRSRSICPGFGRQSGS